SSRIIFIRQPWMRRSHQSDRQEATSQWFAGYHIRSDITAHHKVAEIIGQEILSLELTNNWFYHLDTCFCPLGEEQALFYPAAFDPLCSQSLGS
ncbi:MAG TPA: hypothetical protein VGA09_15690, partial [Candidatus Binatia bacterium]